jgi:anti-sigma B factor antagonist
MRGDDREARCKQKPASSSLEGGPNSSARIRDPRIAYPTQPMDRGVTASGFEITVSQANGLRVLRLAGDFDLAGVGLFESKLDRSGSPRETLVVDLRGLTFIDSSGLRAVVMADRQASARGGRCVVIRGSERIGRVLDLTGVGERLELVDEFAGASSPP